jgi:hypothetical protein
MILSKVTSNFRKSKKMFFFFCLFLKANLLFSQIESFEIIAKFQILPKFNSTCGIIISAEEIKLLSQKDSLKYFIVCSEIYRNEKIDLNTEYYFKVTKAKYTDLNTQIVGIRKDDEEFYLIDSFSGEKE